jgi:uncharacterized protein
LSRVELIDTSALPAVAWKNGGGTTRTVAVSPEGAGFDDFVWRVSIAEVGQSGGFSVFPGVDRTILLLDGAGMVLDRSDGVSQAVTTAFESYAFRGEDVIDARLVNGPSRDFNVMVRRGRARASVRVWDRADAMPWAGEAWFFCARGEFEVLNGGETAWLSADWACGFSVDGATLGVVPKAPNAVLIGALFESEEAA